MNPATLAAGIPWDFETFPEYLASVGRRGTVLNFGAYIGHTALRLYVMGDDAYERDGHRRRGRSAWPTWCARRWTPARSGFATSFAPTHLGVDGKPVPSRVADRSEFEALARVLGELGRGVVARRRRASGFFREIYDFQRRVGVPLTYTALLDDPGLWHRWRSSSTTRRWRGAPTSGRRSRAASSRCSCA